MVLSSKKAEAWAALLLLMKAKERVFCRACVFFDANEVAQAINVAYNWTVGSIILDINCIISIFEHVNFIFALEN